MLSVCYLNVNKDLIITSQNKFPVATESVRLVCIKEIKWKYSIPVCLVCVFYMCVCTMRQCLILMLQMYTIWKAWKVNIACKFFKSVLLMKNRLS